MRSAVGASFFAQPAAGRHLVEIDKVHRSRFANGCSVNGSSGTARVDRGGATAVC